MHPLPAKHSSAIKSLVLAREVGTQPLSPLACRDTAVHVTARRRQGQEFNKMLRHVLLGMFNCLIRPHLTSAAGTGQRPRLAINSRRVSVHGRAVRNDAPCYEHEDGPMSLFSVAAVAPSSMSPSHRPGLSIYGCLPFTADISTRNTTKQRVGNSNRAHSNCQGHLLDSSRVEGPKGRRLRADIEAFAAVTPQGSRRGQEEKA